MSEAADIKALRRAVEASLGRLSNETLGRVICAVFGETFDFVAFSEATGELNVYAAGYGAVWFGPRDRAPDVSIDAAMALARRARPGWWVTCGLCYLTGHASVGPDYNGPDGERLKREFPVEQFDRGFDADLEPGDGPHRTCLAILSALLQSFEPVAATA